MPLSELNEDAAIKQTTERVLDIRTGLLVVRGAEVAVKDSTIDLLGRNVTDAMSIAHNEQGARIDCEDKYVKLVKKTGWQKAIKFLEGIAVGFGVGIILAR